MGQGERAAGEDEEITEEAKNPGLRAIGFRDSSGLEEKHPRTLALMKAQAAVAEYKEFKGNVAFVSTTAFWRDKEASPTAQGYHWNTTSRLTVGLAKRWVKKLREK